MDLEQAARDVLSPLGFEVLELKVSKRGRQRRVMLRVDRLDEGIVSIDDVAVASEAFGLELDRLDPFEQNYLLDVSSPGGDRPLSKPRHFERFRDLLAKVRANGETFTGRIVGVADESVTFEVGKGERTLGMSEIESARLAEWPDEPR